MPPIAPPDHEGETRAIVDETRSSADALPTADELARLAFETSPDGIAITRARDGLIVQVNSGFERLTGWTRQEAVGKTTGELRLWRDPAVRARMAEELVRTGVVENFRAEFAAKDGRRTVALFSARRFLIGDEPHLLSTSRDIAELEAVRRERAEVLEQLQSAQRVEAVARLAGGVAHDFNNLLTIILSCASMLQTRDWPPEDREDLTAIEEAASRAGELTRQLLSFSSTASSDPGVVDLGETCAQMLKMLERIVPETHVIRFERPPEPCTTWADRVQLEQVIANLVVNARDAIADRGTIVVRVRSEGPERVTLEVQDDGSGIPEHALAHIFDPFFTTKGPKQGTGLGLSVVQRIITRWGGRVEASAAPGGGTIMRASLPRSDGQAPRSPRAADAFEGGAERLLIVDDDVALAKVLEQITVDAGYVVQVAQSPDAALGACRQHRPDLVLTDVVMAGMGAKQFAAQMAREFPASKLVFMSGHAGAQLDSELPSGARVLRKPFDHAGLLRELRRALDA